MKIAEYDIVRKQSVSDFRKAVQDKIDSGWQPYGSLALDEVSFVQAMVKYA